MSQTELEARLDELGETVNLAFIYLNNPSMHYVSDVRALIDEARAAVRENEDELVSLLKLIRKSLLQMRPDFRESIGLEEEGPATVLLQRCHSQVSSAEDFLQREMSARAAARRLEVAAAAGRTEVSPNDFPYRPLPKGSSEMRVIYLLPGNFGDEIRCLVKHVDLDKPPRYSALSYVWGDPTVTRPIRLGYENSYFNYVGYFNQYYDFQVTANLEAALRHLRSRYVVRTLWVDAICIDQTNFPERKLQVVRMGQIYATASEVIVWLGRLLEDEEAAARILVQDMKMAWAYLRRAATQSLQDAATHSSLPKPTVHQALQLICRRRWFTRVWVLQEHAVASSPVNILCGQEMMAIDDFLNAIIYVSSFSTRLDPTSLQSYVSAPRHIFWREKFRDPEFHNMPLGDRVLQALVETCGVLNATVPQDRLYGLLGIIGQDLADASLVPNYEKPLDEFYLDLTRFLLESTQTFAVLQGGRSRNQPSWVSTWEKPCSVGFEHLQKIRDYTTIKFSQCGKILYARAVPIGKVSHFRFVQKDMMGDPANLRESMIELEQIVEGMPSIVSRYSNVDSARKALAEAVIGESLWDESQNLLERYEILMGRSSWPGSLQNKGEDEAADLDLLTKKISMTNWAGLGIFFLSTGHIGTVGGIAHDMDVCEGEGVYLFPGCPDPLLLAQDDGGYRIHQSCYIHRYLVQEEEGHIAELEKGPLEDITIV